MNKLKIKKLHQNAILPKYATEGAACFDLHALDVEGYETINIPVTEDAEPVLCRTGLSFDIPDGWLCHAGIFAQRSRIQAQYAAV